MIFVGQGFLGFRIRRVLYYVPILDWHSLFLIYLSYQYEPLAHLVNFTPKKVFR